MSPHQALIPRHLAPFAGNCTEWVQFWDARGCTVRWLAIADQGGFDRRWRSLTRIPRHRRWRRVLARRQAAGSGPGGAGPPGRGWLAPGADAEAAVGPNPRARIRRW